MGEIREDLSVLLAVINIFYIQSDTSLIINNTNFRDV